MNQCHAQDRSFSLLITVHKGQVVNDLCAVLPHESFVEYEPSDLEWMIPLGLVEVIRLPESLVRELSEKASQALYGQSPEQGSWNEVESSVSSRSIDEWRDFASRTIPEISLPPEIIEASEQSSYSSAVVHRKQWDSEH